MFTQRPDPYTTLPRAVACLIRKDTHFLTCADERDDSTPDNCQIRWAMIGGAYGWLHNSSGDIQFYKSRSGIRHAMHRAGY